MSRQVEASWPELRIPGLLPEFRARGVYRDSEIQVPRLEELADVEADYEIPAVLRGKTSDVIATEVREALPGLKSGRERFLDLRLISLVLNDANLASAVSEFLRRVPSGWAAIALPEVVENIEDGLSPEEAVVRYVSKGFPVEGKDRPDLGMLEASGMTPINRETIASWCAVPADRMPSWQSGESRALASVFLGMSNLPRILGYRVLLEAWPGSFSNLLSSCVSNVYDPAEIESLLDRADRGLIEVDNVNDRLFEVQRQLRHRSEIAAMKTFLLFRRHGVPGKEVDPKKWIASFREYALGLSVGRTLPEILAWGEDWSEVYR
ncbi:hypothetical protein [Roseibium sp. RKSG952]|uniref:hypothetical protein n=1 Tax=Roseibium sp. RKSG952 TaxID=2529384 RepID=UPI0012BBC6AC|nr:hypothetical protein [Roseibium sp. RKSG952]MTH94953.1 hypothetical protein [Roseibium sp. RKSG952]